MINPSKFCGRFLGRTAPLVMLLLASANLYGQLPMAVSLVGKAEVPATITSATGVGRITVLPDYTVSGSIETSGLVPTIAHIHEAASGQNGPPIITLAKTANGSFAVPVDARLTETQYASYKAGHLYINVHSARHPNGEIRGQLMYMEIADSPVPPAN